VLGTRTLGESRLPLGCDTPPVDCSHRVVLLFTDHQV
jgi:hypothetical protein